MTRFARRCVAAKGGNIAISFALLLVPMLGAVGLAIDFGRAQTLNRQLAAAADIAALGAIAEMSPGSLAAAKMTGDGSVAVATDDAKKLVLANLPDGVDRSAIAFAIKVEKTGNKLQSEIKLTSEIPATIGLMFGTKTLQVGGVAVAEHQMAKFMDFYILLDNTPSMGVGATSADISSMEKKTSDTCAFACHQLDKPDKDYYALAKKNGIAMRIDIVRQATQELTKTAKATQAVDGQFRMGVYTFGSKAEAAKLTTISSPITDLDKVRDYTNGVDLMTVPYSGYGGDQQTNFDSVFGDVNKLIDTPGDGSDANSREKILFFVSDGVGDAYKPIGCTKTLTGTRCQEPIDIRLCKPLKDRGVKIAVLYTTYFPLPNNGWYNTWIKPFQSQIATQMANCATPGLFYEVSPSGGIANAMTALFTKSVRTVKLAK